MKRSLLFALLLSGSLAGFAQPCIDPSLINPDVMCPMIWDPVCGCDGVTYSNSCVAINSAGVTSYTPGECTGGGDCIDPSLIDPEAACPMIWDPVCGCDGITYSNSCVAQTQAGVTAWTMGECSGGGGDCSIIPFNADFGDCEMFLGYAMTPTGCQGFSGCSTTSINGVDYSSAFFPDMTACETCGTPPCVQIPDGVDFGLCDMALGVAYTSQGCTMLSGCGWTGSDNVDYSTAFFASIEDCQSMCGGGECVDPNQIDPSVLCPMIWDPVCGCNGVTYSNECSAYYYGGVTSWTAGECPPPPGQCYDVSWIDFGPCDQFLGYAFTGSGCTAISGCGYVFDDIDFSPFFFQNEADCVNNCANYEQSCVDENLIEDVFCVDVWDPVCGCDEQTYSNSCVAFYQNGISSWTPGECGGQSIGELPSGTVNVFPVPAQGTLQISIARPLIGEIQLTDMLGNTVRTERLRGQTALSMDLTDVTAGMYVLRVRTDSGRTAVKKIVVE